MTLKGNIVQGAYGRGRGGGKFRSHPRHQREQQHQLQSPHRGKAWGERGEINTHRHPDSADSARPKHGALARRECGLLAPEEPEGDQAAVEPQGSGYSPKDTTRIGSTDRRETGAR